MTPDMIDLKAPATAAARRPTKFMADLSRAMQAAAEAKTVVEEIHAASTEEGASLRRRADDDVAAVREWSKGEIARIREETEARIATRKTALDGEMDAHAQVVEARVQQVAATVSEYEAQMAEFFQRLLVEEDPTRIATMAETMPDPPDLANIAASIAEPQVEPFDPGAARLALIPDAAVSGESSETVAESGAEAGDAAPDFAAAEAEALAFTGDAEVDGDQGTGSAEAVAETVQIESDGSEAPEAVAEAAPADGSGSDASALAASDEGAFGSPAPSTEAAGDAPASTERVVTRVVVLGLVSVASIATFKRSLGRSQGVMAIGVASGPDGEFVFTVTHEAGLSLRDAIVALPGFDARVTGESDGGIDVTAHDPDGD